MRQLGSRARRSSRDNLPDTRVMARSTGLMCAALWPIYGIFCLRVLGFEESMSARLLLSAGCLALWMRSRPGRDWGRLEHAAWILHAVAGLGWLPWHLYFLNGGAGYWQMSIIFFSIALATAARGIDLLVAAGGTVAAVLLTHGQELGHRELPILAVAAITVWLAAAGVHTFRSATRRIAQQARQLSAQNARLQELDRGKDEFSASIAHDLRTPLAVAASLAQDLEGTDLPEPARRRVQSLGQALGQLRRQSDDLMDLNRFRLGVARLDRRTVDIGAWATRFEEGFASMARSRGISFQVVLPRRPLSASVDALRLETALFNLVANAVKFTPPGGHVEVHVARKGAGGFALAVVDDGEGIPPGALQRIFERFQQVDRGPGTYTAGTGIGLALVKEVAEAHGGHVSVQSTLGLGSLFELVFPDSLVDVAPEPLVLSAPSDARGRTPPVRPPVAGRLAVVAEDEPLLRQILHDVLERSMRVATARDGREALRLVHELNPDILVTDLSMPVMDGMELVAALRADPATCALPVVVLTGDPQSLRSRLAPEPDLEVMGKPFEHTALLARVRRMVEKTPVDEAA